MSGYRLLLCVVILACVSVGIAQTNVLTVSSSGSVTASGIVTAPSYAASGSSTGTSVWTATSGVLPFCGPPPCIPTTNAFFLQAPSSISSSFGWNLPTMANSAAQLVYLSAPSGGTNPPASTVGYVAADSTTTHALFATSSAPAFRAIGTNDTTPNYFTTDTGVANAYVIAPATAALTQGTVVRFTTANANTGASTINVNGTGVLSLTKNGTTTALNLGDILSGVVYTAIYDGAEWQLTNPSTGPVSPLIFYSSNQTAAVGSSAVPFSTTTKTATLYGIVIPAPGVVTSKVSYENGAADNTGNLYDIGIYSGSASANESPLVHIGATAGSTFAPVANTWHAGVNWSGSVTVYLPPGRYYLALISNCASGCATMAGQNATVVFGTGTATVGTAGSLSGNLTTPRETLIKLSNFHWGSV